MQRRYSFSFEARSLLYVIQGVALQHGEKLTYGQAIALASERVRELMEGASIDWFAVRDAELPDYLFEDNGDSAAKRYRTDIDIPDDTEEWLERLRQDLKRDFKGITRSLYIPFCIRLVLKADWLNENGRVGEIATFHDTEDE